MFETETDNETPNKYLIYQMGEELFASSLIEVREVIEFHAPKPIPNAAPHHKGVINIRGEIMGVVDLREKLGLVGSDHPLCQLVVVTEKGVLAAIVDKVHSVAVINDSEIDRKATAKGSANSPFLTGVAKHEGQLLTLLSLTDALA